jgi:hypothetical protein
MAVMAAYPLTEEAFRRIVAEVAERRAAKFAGEDAAAPATASSIIVTGGPRP